MGAQDQTLDTILENKGEIPSLRSPKLEFEKPAFIEELIELMKKYKVIMFAPDILLNNKPFIIEFNSCPGGLCLLDNKTIKEFLEIFSKNFENLIPNNIEAIYYITNGKLPLEDKLYSYVLEKIANKLNKKFVISKGKHHYLPENTIAFRMVVENPWTSVKGPGIIINPIFLDTFGGRDKWVFELACRWLKEKYGIEVNRPKTTIVKTNQELEETLNDWKNIVIKPLHLNSGNGIYFLKEGDRLPKKLNFPYVVQELINSNTINGHIHDLRMILIRNKIVGIFGRKARKKIDEEENSFEDRFWKRAVNLAHKEGDKWIVDWDRILSGEYLVKRYGKEKLKEIYWEILKSAYAILKFIDDLRKGVEVKEGVVKLRFPNEISELEKKLLEEELFTWKREVFDNRIIFVLEGEKTISYLSYWTQKEFTVKKDGKTQKLKGPYLGGMYTKKEFRKNGYMYSLVKTFLELKIAPLFYLRTANPNVIRLLEKLRKEGLIDYKEVGKVPENEYKNGIVYLVINNEAK